MTCESAQQHLNALVDGELRLWTAWRTRNHLRRCGGCRAELREVQRLGEAMHQWRAAGPSPEFRERVETAVGRNAVPSSGLAVGAPPRSYPRRRVLSVAMTLATMAGAGWLLMGWPGAPAQALNETLSAMERVLSAHAAGELVLFRERDARGAARRTPATVEYWYRTPGRYRRDVAVSGRSSALIPGAWIIDGEQGWFISASPLDSGSVTPIHPATIREGLTAFGLFASDGFIRQAARKPGAQVKVRTEKLLDKTERVITLRYQEQAVRSTWTLYVDPQTRLVLRAQYVQDRQRGTAWEPVVIEHLRHFDYDQPVPSGLFPARSGQAPA